MAKTVFGSHEQTAHVWAQGRGGDVGNGRSSDGRMFFEGRILFSYGRHFALGLIVLGADGYPDATLLNGSRYSISTSKHQTHAYRAARGRLVYIPELTEAVHTLEDVTGPHAADHKALAKINLARHIANNWAAYTDESAAFVYALAGGTAKQASAIRTKARKAAEKVQAARDKADFAILIGSAKTLARMDANAFRAHHRQTVGDSAYDAPRRHERLLSDMRKAHKAASKAGLEKVKAAIWSHIKAMPALGGRAVAAATIAHKNRYAKYAIRTLRQYWENAKASEPRALNSYQWGQVEEAANAVRNMAERPALANLHYELGQLAGAAHDAKHAAREIEQEAARLAAIESARLAELEEAQAKSEWMAGNTHSRWRGRTDNGGAYLRAVGVEVDGLGAMTGTLQTSQGAEVPLAHALRAFRFIKLCRAKGEAWQANGRTVPVGHFRIDRIAANGDFVAGCHRIEWVEVERLALALGVEGWAADESAVVATAHA